MPVNKKATSIPIFISSTSKDLSDYRKEVEAQLVSLEQSVKGMEHFGANPESPITVCYQKIKESSLMILIVGVSYGTIVPQSEKSFTEMEYDYAIEHNIPVLPYLVDPKSKSVSIPLDAYDYTNKDKLDKFKKKLTENHTISFFSSVDDLGKRIAEDVPSRLEDLEMIKNLPGVGLNKKVTEADLESGANKFERFWLRPKTVANETVPLRLRINKKFSGWRVKDELISAIGLTVGDSVSTEVTVLLGSHIIDDDGETDLFADGKGADWLIDQSIENGGAEGCIIDCYVKFVYCRAPVGQNSKMVNKASLVLVKGIAFKGVDDNYRLNASRDEKMDLSRLIAALNDD